MKTLHAPKSTSSRAARKRSAQTRPPQLHEHSNHLVQFYDSDELLTESLSAFFREAIQTGEAAVVIATAEHRHAVENRLSRDGIDVPQCIRNGQYIPLDAQETLSQFMVGGAPDKNLFKKIIGNTIRKAATGHRGVRAFGEMVALLCAEGKGEAAIQLEGLWNGLLQTHSFSLFCAYPMKQFGDAKNAKVFDHLCAAHSRVLPTESYTAGNETDSEHLRQITALQQQAASLHHEIVSRKHAEDLSRESEARLRAIIDNSTAAIYLKDIEGKYILVNSCFEKLFGISWQNAARKTDFDIFPEAIAKRFRENDLMVIKTGKSIEVEEAAPAPDGLHTYISVKFPLRNSDGSIYAVAGISTDVTDRARSGEVRRHLAAIVESSDDAIISKDLNGIIRSWNNGAQRMFGYTADEIIGRSVMTLIPLDRQNEEPAILARLRNGDPIDHYETVRRRKDGTEFEISLTVSPIKDATGRIVGASKIAHDITHRKRVEMEQQVLYDLATSVNRAAALPEIYKAALNAICRCHNTNRASILLYDGDDTMRFKGWLGLSDEYRRAVEGHSPWQPTDPDPQPVCIVDVAQAPLDEHLRNVVAREGIRALAFLPITYEKRLLGKFMVYYDAPHRFTREELRMAQTVISQVAFAIERQRTGETLERLVNERTASLREAIAQMEEFSYSVSHDLRAPVRAMQCYAEVLLEDYGAQLDENAKKYLHRIIQGGERTDHLIQDTLTYSRLSRREMQLQPVSLDKLTHEIIRHHTEMKSSRAKISVEDRLLDVIGHESSLTQAISNLLSNAVKFVASGVTPHVRVRTEPRGSEVRLWVEDNGIGIKPEYQHRLFSMFERIHPEKNYEGTGIGLAIVRKAAERMGGKAGVESDGINGSKFWIQLPAAATV